MKINKNIGIVIIVLFLLFSSIHQYIINHKLRDNIYTYKSEIILRDSLTKVTDGHYQKLVSDLHTQKELTKKLSQQNKILFDEIKRNKKKPISYTVIQAQPESKIDTITIKDTIRDGHSLKFFKDFYPNKKSPFITYTGEIGKESVVGRFDLDTLNIGIVVSEKKKGLFEADLDAPEWLNVTDITVNSLPLENIRPDNFDWMLGGAAGLDFQNQRPVIEVEGGIRYKKSIFSIQGNTNQEVLVGFKKLF